MIEISELTKYYGERKAVGPLSFHIDQGEVVGLLGLNGAGKTTTLRMLASELLPTSGTMVVDGIDLTDEPERVRPMIGYLPDKPPVYDEMTVSEYLTFCAKLQRVARGKLTGAVRDAVEQTDLGEVRDQTIGTLSHGFRQRVGIAQAIVHKPKLLLLDEPISGLDPVQIVEMRNLINQLRGEHTTVLSSHILNEISETCDRLLVIRQGEIVASGSEADLASQMDVGGHKLSITVRVEGGLDALADVLAVVDGAGAPNAHSGEGGDDVVSAIVPATRDVREDVCRALVDAGVGILRLDHHVEELEDVFLQLTGDRPNEEAKA